MKKIIPLLLMLALMLSGCGLSEQAQTVNEKYIAPAVESARNNLDGTQDELLSGPDIDTDKSALTDFEPVANVCSRLSEEFLSELSASDDYGSLCPYVGAYYYGEGGERLNKYGLVTSTGMIVLDPVLSSLELASYPSGGEMVTLNIYVMGKFIESEDGSGRIMFAVAAADGSWASGFDYTQVLPMELGALCIVDEEANAAVCYGETGEVVFDTRNFSSLSRLASGSVPSLADCSGGYMRISYTNGQSGFMDKNGYILNRNTDMASYFDEVRSFSGGYAAVKLYDNWNYIGTNGYYAIYGLFEEAGDFINGVAVVKKDGVLCVINSENKILKEFPAAASVAAYDGWVCATAADGTETYYLTPTMEEADLYGMPLNFCSDGYWIAGETGIRVRTFAGEEYYFSGAVSYEGSSGDELHLVTLADGTQAVLDGYSRAVAVQDAGSIGFISDSETGETYIYTISEDGARLYSSSGLLAADGAILRENAGGEYYGLSGGLINCSDEYSSGLKNMSNEWVFRIKVDTGD